MFWKKRNWLLWLLWGLFGLGQSSPQAVEMAKPLTDREIIEALTELKAGQKNLEQRFEQVNQRFAQVDQRFEQLQKSLDQRFAQVDQRFEQLQKSQDQRFEQLQKSQDQRFTFLENLVMIMIAGIFGLIGFVVWDRKTALRPLEKKLDRLEQDLQHDLELQRPDGSRLTRLIHALGELAKHDPQVATTLKAFSLL